MYSLANATSTRRMMKRKADQSPKNSARLGLVGMRERIEMVGGSLTIDSVRGTGTTVRAEIPFVPDGKTQE